MTYFSRPLVQKYAKLSPLGEEKRHKFQVQKEIMYFRHRDFSSIHIFFRVIFSGREVCGLLFSWPIVVVAIMLNDDTELVHHSVHRESSHRHNVASSHILYCIQYGFAIILSNRWKLEREGVLYMSNVVFTCLRGG